MKTQPPTAGILIACLVSILFLGLWLLGRGPANVPAGPTPTIPTSRTVTSTPFPELSRATASPLRHRLAGTVIGDVRYAVVETADGRSDLYRIGETIPGLGRLAEIEADRAIFEGEHGRIEIRLAPADTPTFTPRRPPPAPGVTPRKTPERAPAPRPSEEPPSGDSGRSAS